MNLKMPQKGEVVVCKECRHSQPHIYSSCEKPCSWLVSWVMHETQGKVSRALTRWGCEHHFLISTFGHIQFQTCEHCGRQLMRSHEDEEWTVVVMGNEM